MAQTQETGPVPGTGSDTRDWSCPRDTGKQYSILPSCLHYARQIHRKLEEKNTKRICTENKGKHRGRKEIQKKNTLFCLQLFFKSMLLTKPLKFLLSPVLNVKNILLMKHNNFL
jgi:hypothetical protein